MLLLGVCNVITWYSCKGNSECIVENIYGPGSWSLVLVLGPVSGSWSLSWVMGPALRSRVLFFLYALLDQSSKVVWFISAEHSVLGSKL